MAGLDPYAALGTVEAPAGADPYAAMGTVETNAPALHTWQVTKPDGSKVQFQLPENTPDDVVRAHGAQAVGDTDHSRTYILNRTGAPPPPEDHSAATGFLAGVMKPIDNAAEWLHAIPGVGAASDAISRFTGLPTTDQAVATNDAIRANNDRTGFQTAGNIVGTLPTMEIAGAGAAGLLAQGAASGALLSDHKDLGGTLLDAGIGAGGSLAGGKLLQSVGAAVAPRLDAARAALANAGVQFTPGQLLGGAAKHIEDAFTHLPFVGDAITAARARGYQQFNRGAVNDALGHIGQAVPDRIETGHGAIAYAKKAFGDHYDATLARAQIVPDSQFVNDVADVTQRMTDGTLSAESADQLGKTGMSVIVHRLRSGNVLDGQTVKSIVSELRTRAGQASDPAYKQALSDLGSAVRSAAARTSPPDVASDLANADAGYAKFAVLRRAAATPENGIFSPAQLQTASRANDTSISKGASATGSALLQPYAEAGRAVLPSKVGDSGTGPRMLANSVAAGLLGGGAHFISPSAAAYTALGTGAASAAYSPAAIGLLNRTFARQAGPTAVKAADLLRLLAPIAGAASAPIAISAASPQR